MIFFIKIKVGWDIQYRNEEAKKNIKKKDLYWVGLLGHENKGKTFIGNLLCNKKFPSGFHVNQIFNLMKTKKNQI